MNGSTSKKQKGRSIKKLVFYVRVMGETQKDISKREYKKFLNEKELSKKLVQARPTLTMYDLRTYSSGKFPSNVGIADPETFFRKRNTGINRRQPWILYMKYYRIKAILIANFEIISSSLKKIEVSILSG